MRVNRDDFKKHWIRLTRCCNNRCLFCHDSIEQNGTFMPFQEIAEELERGRKAGAEVAVLSGGEPTIHPEFLKIVEYAGEAGYQWIQTISNGRLFAYSSFITKAVNAGLNEITFSINAHTPELFDEITGVKGSFSQSYRGLVNALKTEGLVVSVDIVVTKMNVRHIPETLQILNKLGAREFELMYPMPFGRAWENKDRILISGKEAAEALNTVGRSGLTERAKIWTSRFPEEIFEGREFLIQAPEKIIGDVLSHTGYFMGFLSEGVPIPCFGERCAYCFLKHFCSRLETLKRDVVEKKAMPYFVSKNAAGRAVSLPPPEAISRLFCENIDVFRTLSPFIKEHNLPAAVIFPKIPEPSDIPEHSDIQICIVLNNDTAEKLSVQDGLPGFRHDIIIVMDNRKDAFDELKNGFFAKKDFRRWLGSLPYPVANIPPCVRNTPDYLKLAPIPVDVYDRDTGWRLDSVSDYLLIKERYCKPAHCGECCYDSVCTGLYINLAKVFGFCLSCGPLKCSQPSPDSEGAPV